MAKTNFINYPALWDRVGEWARKAGKASSRPVLLLYYVMKSKNTPWKDKMAVLSAISYLVFPIDILDAKRLPVIGWFDEIASISIAYQKVKKHITPEIEAKVENVLDRWFPEYTEFEEVTV